MLPAEPLIAITLERFEGSSPREAGVIMVVTAHQVLGTIGGGHLEYQAIAHARQMLSDSSLPETTQRVALGPSLGQCCGGVVWLRYEHIAIQNATKRVAIQAYFMPAGSPKGSQKAMPVALFGGGHVGKAIVQVLGNLPCAVHWIDSRDEIFPDAQPANVRAEHSAPVQAAVKDLAAGSHVLIMSFSHAEDLDVVAACLLRWREKGDLPFVGLIGSKTKWATFSHRLLERGFSHEELRQVTCPIGAPGIKGKEPEVIAIAVAAQLMGLRTSSSPRISAA